MSSMHVFLFASCNLRLGEPANCAWKGFLAINEEREGSPKQVVVTNESQTQYHLEKCKSYRKAFCARVVPHYFQAIEQAMQIPSCDSNSTLLQIATLCSRSCMDRSTTQPPSYKKTTSSKRMKRHDYMHTSICQYWEDEE
eukprot:2233447-Amphidinium_carterae.1